MKRPCLWGNTGSGQDIDGDCDGINLVVVAAARKGDAFVDKLIEPLGRLGYEDSPTFDDGEDGVDSGDFVVNDFVRNDGHTGFALEFLDEGLTRGFVLDVHGAKTASAPAGVEADEALLEFWEVKLAAQDVNDVDVSVAL